MFTQESESIRLLLNESMDDFLNKFKGITNNLHSLGRKVKIFDMNNKVLRSLPMEYNSIMNPIEIYKNINKMSFREFMSILKNAVIKMILQKSKRAR